MPFQSEKQRRFLHANHPEIAKRWEREYATGGISNHFRKKIADGGQLVKPGPGRPGYGGEWGPGGEYTASAAGAASYGRAPSRASVVNTAAMEDANIGVTHPALTRTPRGPTYQNIHQTGAVTQTPGRSPVGITGNYMNPTFRKAAIDRITQHQLANRPTEDEGQLGTNRPTEDEGQLGTWQSMFGDIKPIADLKAEKIYGSTWGKTPIQWDKLEAGSADMWDKQFNAIKCKYETWGDLYQAGLEGKLGIANAQILTQNKEGFKTLAKELPDAGGNLDVEDQFTDWSLQDLYEQKSGTGSYSLNLPLIGEPGVEKGGTGTGLAIREADEFLTKAAEAEHTKAGR